MYETPLVDVVLPVYNEQSSLEKGVRTLNNYLQELYSDNYLITIADNASIDNTSVIGERLASSLPRVRYVRIDQKGRGRALKQVWSSSNASILGYMDIDLATGLEAISPIVAALNSGYAQVGIGTRLRPQSRVVRIAKRELISRCYNKLLRITLGTKTSDAQCGFKFVTNKAFQELSPHILDTEWFFDTELLYKAERSGMRIFEVPVDWTDDPDSRVHVGSTARKDVEGIVRLHRENGTHSSDSVPKQGRSMNSLMPVMPMAERVPQIVHANRYWPVLNSRRFSENPSDNVSSFVLIGALSTVLYSGLFAIFNTTAPARTANIVALVISTIVNTWANDKWSFNAREKSMVNKYFESFIVLALTLVMTDTALAVGHHLNPSMSRMDDLGLVTLANLMATVVKWYSFKLWVFRNKKLKNSRKVAPVAATMMES